MFMNTPFTMSHLWIAEIFAVSTIVSQRTLYFPADIKDDKKHFVKFFSGPLRLRLDIPTGCHLLCQLISYQPIFYHFQLKLNYCYLCFGYWGLYKPLAPSDILKVDYYLFVFYREVCVSLESFPLASARLVKSDYESAQHGTALWPVQSHTGVTLESFSSTLARPFPSEKQLWMLCKFLEFFLCLVFTCFLNLVMISRHLSHSSQQSEALFPSILQVCIKTTQFDITCNGRLYSFH